MDVSIEEILHNIGVSSVDVISHDGPEFPNSFPVIDRQIAHWIDQQLESEDAVAFAFLVVQKEEIALQLSRFYIEIIQISHGEFSLFSDFLKWTKVT